MAGKRFSALGPSRLLRRRKYGWVAVLMIAGADIRAADAPGTEPRAPRFLGELSCSSSGCHGGARSNLNQFTLWTRHDVHTRAQATLTTPRSRRLAELLDIGDPVTSPRCTACHAPFHEVPPALRGPQVRVEAGVSCESCHGAGERWLRSHARPDYTHAERVATGLRDLKDLHQRANTCVACHQYLEPELRSAGHPPLIFELDGQCASQPRHWRERAGTGGQSWLVGQAVALREMSWRLERESAPDPSTLARWQALAWVVELAARGLDTLKPELSLTNLAQATAPTNRPTASDFQRARQSSEALARRTADLPWSRQTTERLLRRLADVAPQFNDAQAPRLVHASRAERLVLGLDRLWLAAGNRPNPVADERLQNLFDAVQSLPDFEPDAFARQLEAFAADCVGKIQIGLPTGDR